jgi:hypothetical protein
MNAALSAMSKNVWQFNAKTVQGCAVPQA